MSAAVFSIDSTNLIDVALIFFHLGKEVSHAGRKPLETANGGKLFNV